ncbi:hypothetical protein N7510_001271 [Penicillium lagena]|uniref:uncharacterized protein n=1 Tax=Penicillium lagena TaxID=94218 RepID=UPI0025413A77|nr:uncharacterized protein N7510_001271 [Penicillium lagena]KAJ5624962.1 hypothetical protein N7510_001271 [Penicillium lagena]
MRPNRSHPPDAKVFHATDSQKGLYRRGSRIVSGNSKSAHRGEPYSRPSISGIDNTDAYASYETSADRLLGLLVGDEFDSSGNVRTGRNPIQQYSNTSKEISLDFDLYDASCSDAAIHSVDHCVSIIKGLDPGLRSYLLEQFWTRSNSCIPVVHKGAFLASLEEENGEFCSPELHLAVLAMGFRRADHRRSDVMQLSLPDWDSILHKKLRLVIDNLSTRKEPRSNTHVQAVIILAQLEWERGRDHSARLYLDTAFTIIEEIQNRQHDLDTPVSDDEIIVQRIALRAASLIDRSLFEHNFNTTLGDRSRDLHFATSHHLRSNPPSLTIKQDLSSQIYNAHLELMSIATNAIEQLHSQPIRSAENPFSRLTELHSRLQSCQQFHAVLILLYRPFASQETLMSIMDSFTGVNINQLSEYICNILLTNARRIADLIFESRAHFEPGAIFPLSVQQGALAAGVLLAHMSRIEGKSIGDSVFGHLKTLHQFFIDMSALQRPAERLARTLRDITVVMSSCGSPTERWKARTPTQSIDITNPDREQVETSVNRPNDAIWLNRDDEIGEGNLPGQHHDCAAQEQDAAAATPSKNNEGPVDRNPDGFDPIRNSDRRTELPLSASNKSIGRRPHSESLLRGYDPTDPESVPSSNAIQKSPTRLTAVDMSLESGGSFAPQFPLGTDPLSLPVAGPELDACDKDAVSVSWSDTFKALRAVHERPGSEKMVANEFGDVMGGVFKLW